MSKLEIRRRFSDMLITEQKRVFWIYCSHLRGKYLKIYKRNRTDYLAENKLKMRKCSTFLEPNKCCNTGTRNPCLIELWKNEKQTNKQEKVKISVACIWVKTMKPQYFLHKIQITGQKHEKWEKSTFLQPSQRYTRNPCLI